MQYLPKVKFQASLVSDDIVPGAAFDGFETSAFDTTDLGIYHCMLEDPTNGKWELCRYDPAATSGFRRQVLTTGTLGGHASSVTGLTCSFVADPSAYVVNSDEIPITPPLVKSVSSMAIGKGAEVGVDSPNSLAIKGVVRDTSPKAVVIGGWAGHDGTSVGFEADTSDVYNSGASATFSRRGSVALGKDAVTTTAGEVALGSKLIPHMSGVPIMTDDPSAGGTFTFKAVSTNDGSFVLHDILGNSGTYLPGDGGGGGNDFGNWVVRVEGTIVARATDAANDKVVKVEWVTGGSLTQTVLTNGANNISLGLALSGMRLQATVAAVDGLKLSGYLHLTKITW